MTKDDVITVVEASWRRLDSSVEGLGEAALLEPGVVGEWSLKDIRRPSMTETNKDKTAPLRAERCHGNRFAQRRLGGADAGRGGQGGD